MYNKIEHTPNGSANQNHNFKTEIFKIKNGASCPVKSGPCDYTYKSSHPQFIPMYHIFLPTVLRTWPFGWWGWLEVQEHHRGSWGEEKGTRTSPLPEGTEENSKSCPVDFCYWQYDYWITYCSFMITNNWAKRKKKYPITSEVTFYSIEKFSFW